ncbi:riboflavin synthase [Litorimonas sp.]|jgi:riboflavin synthase|uniref:riboflavin synthase n=1 Tax=Litorimonas sp. TaxID=1892381 RepID=UPI003A87D414
MFTGIVTDIGRVVSIDRDQSGSRSEWGDTRMVIDSHYDCDTIAIGASISHAGACMTVVEKDKTKQGCRYAFDVSDESLDKTTLKSWTVGHEMNLERAMTAADELGGHLVTGHVDQIGALLTREPLAGSLKLVFSAPPDLMAMIAPKGSITIDGVSLTVNTSDKTSFSVNIIPHTAEVTTLGQLQPGDKVNLEIDLIARYVARYLSQMKDKS